MYQLNYFEILQNLNPEIDLLEEQKIITPQNVCVGYHSSIILKNKLAFSGGTATTPETARRIAVAEGFERSLFIKFLVHENTNEFLTKEYPTTSGFAAGFEPLKTQFRAICEGVERWAWSKWIDENYYIPEAPISRLKHSSLSNELARSFDSFKIFQKEIFLNSKEYNINLKLVFSIFLGFKGQGVFAGSRVTNENDEPWEHSIIEAYRNYSNFLFESGHFFNKALTDNSLIACRARYFATHKHEALSQIHLAKKNEWVQPRIQLLKSFDTKINNVFLYRCLMNDWLGWHIGDERRFVY